MLRLRAAVWAAAAAVALLLLSGCQAPATKTPPARPTGSSQPATADQLTTERGTAAPPDRRPAGSAAARRFLPLAGRGLAWDRPPARGRMPSSLPVGSGATHAQTDDRAHGGSSGVSGERSLDGGLAPSADPRLTLLAERVGYGAAATGGLDGPLVRVTTLADDGPGSLRAAAAAQGPAWIVFDVDGELHLRDRLWVSSDKTIDGRGRSIEIRDHGLALRGAENVIITNLRLVRGERDGVDVHGRSRNVWLHRLTVIGFEDGAIDITRGATDITVSWCRILDQTKVMLVGADEDHEGDADMRVTLHHTLFEGTGQRHPRLRWGRVHAFNNVLVDWDSFGMAASQHGQLYSEHNVFVPGPDSEEAIKASAGDPAPGRVASVGDVVIGEARIEVREADAVFDPAQDYDYAGALEPAGEALVERLRAGAGWQGVPAPLP